MGSLVQVLSEIGYAGPVSLELMNPELWATPAERVADFGRQALERMVSTRDSASLERRSIGEARKVSVASIRPAAAVYREDQLFAWWLYVLSGAWISIALVALSGFAHRLPFGEKLVSSSAYASLLWCGFGLLCPLLLLFCCLRMTTLLTPTELRLWLGWAPSLRRWIPVDSIVRVECVTIERTVGPWNWGLESRDPGELIYAARGDKGVLIVLADDTKIVVGTQRSDELAGCLLRAIISR